MNILIVYEGLLPAKLYGGTERVVWSLGKELVKLGHKVTYLTVNGSYCDFASIIIFNKEKPLHKQIPDNIDIVHFNSYSGDTSLIRTPYINTMHGNTKSSIELDINTVFVSKNHAERYGSKEYVQNGLDWNEYTLPDFSIKRNYFHFLGNAAWRVKNVKGAIDIVKDVPNERLKILGGYRFNFKMGMRFTFSPKISFEGMVGGTKKDKLINGSKGLIFPVRWNEPFGLAIIESLFYGCPIFGTPYGSLPELVPPEVGYLSSNKVDLVNAVKDSGSFSARRCHEFAQDNFNSKVMTLDYIEKYHRVLSGETLNPSKPMLLMLQETKFLEWNS